jgi:hypothetical protein
MLSSEYCRVLAYVIRLLYRVFSKDSYLRRDRGISGSLWRRDGLTLVVCFALVPCFEVYIVFNRKFKVVAYNGEAELFGRALFSSFLFWFYLVKSLRLTEFIASR